MSNRANLANGLTAATLSAFASVIKLQPGYAAGMPPVPFFATITPFGQLPTMGNSEIVRVTSASGDNLNIVRAQKGTTAKSFAAGAVVTNSVYTDDKIGADNIDWSKVTNVTDGRIGIITGTARVVYKNQSSISVSNAGTFPTGYFKSPPTVTFGGCRIDNNNASGEVCNIFGVTKDKFGIWSRNINGHSITVTLLVDWIAIGERA